MNLSIGCRNRRTFFLATLNHPDWNYVGQCAAANKKTSKPKKNKQTLDKHAQNVVTAVTNCLTSKS